MKNYVIWLLFAFIMSACHQAQPIKLHPVKVDSAEMNVFILNTPYSDPELTDGLENGFSKTLTLTRKDETDTYSVTFSSSSDPKTQKPCCRYKGWGTRRNDSIFVEIEGLNRSFTLIIASSKESEYPRLLVSTIREADMEALKDFCSGGKTLTGIYSMENPSLP